MLANASNVKIIEYSTYLIISLCFFQSHLYKYKKIIDLDKSSSVNFYGRVINFKPPRQTRGSGKKLLNFY